jgi:hypothetical protein
MNLFIIQTESNREVQRNYLPIHKFEREELDKSEFIIVLKLVEFLIATFPDLLIRLLSLCEIDRTEALSSSFSLSRTQL